MAILHPCECRPLPPNGQQVNIIGHEAPAQDVERFQASVAGEQAQVLGAVVIAEEDRLPIVPALAVS
jgi:hypothetical protein